MYRTLFCNDIRDQHIGQTVQLAGWVDVVRDHGGVIFVDLRDYTGVTQVVVHDESFLAGVNRETVISVSGKVEKRDPDTVNTKIATGYVELIADSLGEYSPLHMNAQLRLVWEFPNEEKIIVSFCDNEFSPNFIEELNNLDVNFVFNTNSNLMKMDDRSELMELCEYHVGDWTDIDRFDFLESYANRIEFLAFFKEKIEPYALKHQEARINKFN